LWRLRRVLKVIDFPVAVVRSNADGGNPASIGYSEEPIFSGLASVESISEQEGAE
jgi:hypothetical protein